MLATGLQELPGWLSGDEHIALRRNTLMLNPKHVRVYHVFTTCLRCRGSLCFTGLLLTRSFFSSRVEASFLILL